MMIPYGRDKMIDSTMSNSLQGSDRRELACCLVQRGTFDLLVIGGGILGLSAAWQAARAGLRVAVVEAGDFAGATTSASSKLVHGGLRYLAMGDLRLVYENHAERRALSSRVAPHLVRPLPFLVPVYDDSPYGRAALGAGVMLYSALSLFRDGTGRPLSPTTAKRYVPALRTRGLRGVVLYHDHQMNDSRLALTVALAAQRAGATLLNHAEVVALRKANGRVCGAQVRDVLTGAALDVDAAVVLNATGPWVDRIRAMEDPRALPSIRLAKGAHLVMRRHRAWSGALTNMLGNGRVSFAIPWEDHLLLGTTDEAYDGDPAGVRCTPADVAQLLAEAGRGLHEDQLRPEDVTYAFAGLRVLPGGAGDTAHARRETVIQVGPAGLITVAGGKWTTFRRIGAEIVRHLRPLLPATTPERDPVELPGAIQPAAATRVLRHNLPDLPTDVARHLARHYGTVANELAGLTVLRPELAARIHPDGPDIWAQVSYGVSHEWACDVDDILCRRTTVAVRGLATEQVREQVSRFLASAGRS
jgi:glycerol-3-phosphate dehydrogenase